MKPERWTRIAQIYELVSGRPEPERLPFLIEACGGDEDLRREVESLLAQDVSRETEALGRLEHPGIARIYDAGTAESSWGAQPYFAMELIRGLPLLEYASQSQLPTDQRIELMIKVCEAVNHAHQRGVIHRDL